MMLFLARYSVVGILVSITVLITVYLGVSRSIYFKHSDKGMICFIPVLQLGVLFKAYLHTRSEKKASLVNAESDVYSDDDEIIL